MLIKIPYGRFSEDWLLLGVQTNVGDVEADAHRKAVAWAPRKAKSYTIIELIHTDYHKRPQPVETGYASIRVSYYTGVAEGKTSLTKTQSAV